MGGAAGAQVIWGRRRLCHSLLLAAHHRHVAGDLLAEALNGGEAELVAQLTGEGHAELAAVEVPAEVEEVRLDGGGTLGINGGACSHVDDRLVAHLGTAVADDAVSAVYAVPREELPAAAGLDVGGWEADGASDLMAGHNATIEKEAAAEVAFGEGHVATGDGGAHEGGA